MLHKPSSQEGAPFVALHALLHIPQSSTEVRSVSQWSLSDSLQSAVPGAHSMLVQTPPLQKFEAQATLHFPQFDGSPRTSTSQTVSARPSHSAKPASQGPLPHAPFQQAPAGSHTVPHPPQLSGSVSGLRHAPSQHDQPSGQVSSVAQLGVHTESRHAVPG
jgi:hypothetical protein